MKIDKMVLLKSTTKASLSGLLNIVFFSLIGLTFNWILLAFLFPEMQTLFSNLGGLPIARAGGIGAVIALVFIIIELWPVTLIVLGFGILFPGLHFLFGKKFAVTKALYQLLGDNRGIISEYLSERLEESIRKKAETDNTKGKNFSIAQQIQNLPYYLTKLDNLPFPLTALVSRLTQKLKVDTLLKEISAKIPDQENPNSEDLQNALKKTIDFAILETISSPSFQWFFILGGINFGTFLVLKILI
ncbi:hypothetical protein JWG44_13925 [Leptospira sp. 201903071]|uniref:hypothetical protein n=1 Tax=Leptospira ainazelensis TaxID=2810034 RepID=UPI001964144A|nr:hypothetical protein [Leptospira ainazelensis]MBM9501351.1 hypothetical protein [Leptospira ainazelensis]